MSIWVSIYLLLPSWQKSGHNTQCCWHIVELKQRHRLFMGNVSDKLLNVSDHYQSSSNTNFSMRFQGKGLKWKSVYRFKPILNTSPAHFLFLHFLSISSTSPCLCLPPSLSSFSAPAAAAPEPEWRVPSPHCTDRQRQKAWFACWTLPPFSSRPFMHGHGGGGGGGRGFERKQGLAWD